MLTNDNNNVKFLLMTVKVSVTLYGIQEALTRLKELTGLDYSDQGLRNRMNAEKLPIHRVGNVDLITEQDLLQLSRVPKPKRGRRW
jgi:hypothetical protein